MRACNKEAKEKKLKGDARKKFVGECLKAKKPSWRGTRAARRWIPAPYSPEGPHAGLLCLRHRADALCHGAGKRIE